ncbi:monocarboxylate transporter 12 [Anopheles merus]|uniref:monocarboxylate transporter 12 n=1 Tax=Anopheles merus TaxID=30066 RepID=UPI001BE4A5A0|nr:monocarboxylate transporter 12 [Anopheles merus]XP_041762067.1 monocarboxylate transporter 12 [Anopheles merus]XP_041762068.1 monocarboxylate transporter 12 [Anopheles merus]XP_041762069.1 monocarboxylate transporter 12 [Anopheles merus]XP_041762070.1 monocarboxylate transporter 12 [Anopheles merus]
MGEESLERSEGKLLQPHVADYSPVRQDHQHPSSQAAAQDDPSQEEKEQNGNDENNSTSAQRSVECPKPNDSSPVQPVDTIKLNKVLPPALTLVPQTDDPNGPSRAHEPEDSAQNQLESNGRAALLPRNGSATICRSISNSTMQPIGTKTGQTERYRAPDEGGDPEDGTTDDDYELVPPDGGWGWLVLAGSMLVNILVPGTIKSFGVLFVEFLEAFQASPSSAAWIPALCYFLYSSLGPLSSILSVKYSYRTVTIVGGTFAAVGMIITFWATSVNYLYISYGVLVGTGAGLSFPPTVYIVTSYFVKLRGLANGLCISGSALGSIILPPVLRFLLENYGYRGACLIMGGITLNVWVAAIFYEPVEKHLKRVRKVKPDEDDDGQRAVVVQQRDVILEECESNETDPLAEDRSVANGQTNANPNASQSLLPQGKSGSVKPKFAITGDDTPTISTPTLEHKSPDIFRFNPKNGLIDSFARSASAAAVPVSYGRDRDDMLGGAAGGTNQRQRKISTPIKEEHRNLTFTSQLSSNSFLGNEGTLGSYFRLNRLNSTRSGMGQQSGAGQQLHHRPPKRSPSTSSFQYMSTPFHGSTLSTHQPKEFASHLSLRSFGGSVSRGKSSAPAEDATVERNKSDSKMDGKTFFDLSLLSDPSYLVILISNSTNAIGYTNFIILLPAYAISLGFDKSLAAYLLSIVSTLDLVGRIGGSALSDTNLIPKTWYFVGGLSISGLALALLPTVRDYTMVSVFCGLFGLASGTYVGITAVIMADMLGTERLTSSYGISLFVNGILQLVGPPICGVIFENMGRYQPLFTALGFVLLGGSALWGFMPLINRQKRRKAEAAAKAAEAEATTKVLAEHAFDEDDDQPLQLKRDAVDKALIA